MAFTLLPSHPRRGRSSPLGLCALCVCLSTAWSQEQDGDHHDEIVQLADLPALAREAVTLKTRSWTLKSVEVERDGERTTYEAEATSSGQTLEVTVTADGQIVAQKFETDSQESGHEEADDELDELDEHDEQDGNEVDDDDADEDQEDGDDDDADGEADSEDGADADHDHEGEEDGEH